MKNQIIEYLIFNKKSGLQGRMELDDNNLIALFKVQKHKLVTREFSKMAELSLGARLVINLVINLHKKYLNWKPRIVEYCLIFQPKLLQFQMLEYRCIR
jgi:hypothetical protein